MCIRDRCLTTRYCAKVQAAAGAAAAVSDNCLRELLLATELRKPVVPLVRETRLFEHPAEWGAVLCMLLGGHLRADDDLRLHRQLCATFGGGPLRRVVLRTPRVARVSRRQPSTVFML